MVPALEVPYNVTQRAGLLTAGDDSPRESGDNWLDQLYCHAAGHGRAPITLLHGLEECVFLQDLVNGLHRSPVN